MPGQVLHKVPLFGWAIFVTAVLLLLSLPVLAGIIIIILPALNSAICWKLFYIIKRLFYIIKRQSAENFEYLGVQRILRDYTPESIYYENHWIDFELMSNSINNNYYHFATELKNKLILKDKRYFYFEDNNNYFSNLNPSFCSYLAGLIEGDGTIIVPKKERSLKGRLNYPSIQISFDLRDFPLAMTIQKELGYGSLSRTKGVNAYRLTINDYKGLILLANILNGNMRTPKIEMLYLLIDYLNKRFSNLNIIRKEIDISNLNNNEWLSGFIDADGHFFVNATYSSISCGFELVQSSVNHLGLSKKDIMLSISNYLNVSLKLSIRKKYSNYSEYRIKTVKLDNNLKLVYYLKKNNLYSSKYLNYLDWLLVLNLISENKHKSLEGKNQIRLIRDGMNNKRTYFNWNHLQNFHSLYR